MDEVESLAALFSRLRAHDKAIAQQVVDLYQPMLLHVAGCALSRLGLRRLCDPEDITQRVFQNFFTRVIPQREVAGWQELAKLLVAMTMNQVRDEWRHAHALRRTSGQAAEDETRLEARAAPGDGVGHDLEIEDEINKFHKLLSEQEWSLAWAWACRESWPQMATHFGQSAGKLRRELARILNRIRSQVESGE